MARKMRSTWGNVSRTAPGVFRLRWYEDTPQGRRRMSETVRGTRREADNITGVLIGDIVLQLLSYVAQVERENTHQRQAEGIAAARARGVRFGRPRKQRPDCYGTVRESYLGGEVTRREAAERLGVCLSTFDRWLKEDVTGEKSVPPS